MDDINEIIADAIAEEEVAKENGYTIPKVGIAERTTEVIAVDLENYIALRKMRDDYIKLLDIIERSMELSKYDKNLRLDGEEVVNFYRINYRDLYNHIVEELKAKAED